MSDDRFTVDGIFQAKVTRKSDTIKGIYLTLEISGDDYSPALAQLRAGSLLKMGWQELLNVEVEPIEVETPTAEEVKGILRDDWRPPTNSRSAPITADAVPRPQANEAGISRPKKRFEELPLSQQAALRCGGPAFCEFLEWHTNESPIVTSDEAAFFVRTLCGVTSRSEIKSGTLAADLWKTLEAEYQDWLTDQRHAESIRR